MTRGQTDLILNLPKASVSNFRPTPDNCGSGRASVSRAGTVCNPSPVLNASNSIWLIEAVGQQSSLRMGLLRVGLVVESW